MPWKINIDSSHSGTPAYSYKLRISALNSVSCETKKDKGENMNIYTKNHQSEEDYLESILMLSRNQEVVHRIDVAKRMNVSQAAVNKAVKLLCEKEYVYEDGKHLYLSPEGKVYAEAVYEKHCIIRDFLIQNGVSAPSAEEDACRMEHLISDETFEMMKKLLSK